MKRPKKRDPEISIIFANAYAQILIIGAKSIFGAGLILLCVHCHIPQVISALLSGLLVAGKNRL